MANELKLVHAQAGATVTARVYDRANTQVGADTPLTEVVPFVYGASFDVTALAAGTYLVVYVETVAGVQALLGCSDLHVNAGQELELSSIPALFDEIKGVGWTTETLRDIRGNLSDATAANQTAVLNAVAGLNDVDVPSVVSGLQAVADDFKADTTGLSTFDPAADTVARVTRVDVNTDMRGTDGANTVAPDNAAIAAQVRTELAPELVNLDAPVSGALQATDYESPAALVVAVDTLIKYHDNETRFLAADNVTETTQPEAYFMATFDGGSRLKTIAFQSASGAPAMLPTATRYVKL